MPRPSSTGSTRSTWPRSAPVVRRAPASTTRLWPTRRSTGATAAGSAVPAARAASCAGSRIRSARPTATGPRCPTRCCWSTRSPGIERVTARLAATRRDRFTARLPMLRRPHPEGDVGAVRVEVRGRRGDRRDVRVLGVMDRPGVAAGAVAAVAAVLAAGGELQRTGAGGPGRDGGAGAVPHRAGPPGRARRGVRRGRQPGLSGLADRGGPWHFSTATFTVRADRHVE